MDVELGPDGSYGTTFKQTESVLDFFNDYGKGTYFIDADLLEHNGIPPLGKNEVGSHGYKHSTVGNNWWIKNADKQFDAAFSIKKSTELIKDKLGTNPISFRAPKFSISKGTFHVLKQNGYKIDSSIAPFNDFLFPKDINGIMEIPVSRVQKPSLYVKGLPHLRYDGLMVSLLQEYGVEKMLDVTKQILSCWHNKKYPMLCFMGHPWEFDKDTFDLLRQYIKGLEKIIELKYVTMKEYYELIS